MTIDWPNLVAGTIVGIFAHWQVGSRLRSWSERRTLRRKYACLAGDYANYRDKDGKQQATGGKIRLTWESDGSFKMQGLHSNDVCEWEGTVRMSLDFDGTGIGRYRYAATQD